MEIRIAGPDDFDAVADFVSYIGYFNDVDPDAMGGTWVLAEDGGTIKGVVWFFSQAPQAYVDYWCAVNPHVAKSLGLLTASILKLSGVRYVRAVVAADNEEAAKFAEDGFGFLMQADYYLCYKEL